MDHEWRIIHDNVKELRADVRNIDNKLDKLTTDHAVHKVKSSFWGALGGILVNIINLFR